MWGCCFPVQAAEELDNVDAALQWFFWAWPSVIAVADNLRFDDLWLDVLFLASDLLPCEFLVPWTLLAESAPLQVSFNCDQKKHTQKSTHTNATDSVLDLFCNNT